MENISFKLSDKLTEQLQEVALTYGQKSRHKFARVIVEDYLQDATRQRMNLRLGELEGQVRKLREDLATITGGILMKAGKVQTLKEAERWVLENFYA